MRGQLPPGSPPFGLEMNKTAKKRHRFGYWRIRIILGCKSLMANKKKHYRNYREGGLSVRRKRGRRGGHKRARGNRPPLPVPQRTNQRWSFGFLPDRFKACRKFRILAVNDDCCRETLGLIADTSLSGARVARKLDALVRIYGAPASIVLDTGTGFNSTKTAKWANETKVAWHCARSRQARANRLDPASGQPDPRRSAPGA